jgi:hypothetical protein
MTIIFSSTVGEAEIIVTKIVMEALAMPEKNLTGI